MNAGTQVELAPRLLCAGVHRWVRDFPKASDHAPTWITTSPAETAAYVTTEKKPLRARKRGVQVRCVQMFPSQEEHNQSKLIRIGCAGWALRSTQLDVFGEGASQLARYATRFDTVEINSSFYRAHQKRTYERWAQSVPEQFRFSVKVPKAITHQARLVNVEALIDQFATEIEGLGKKLGGILVQLPPSLSCDLEIAAKFFSVLRRHVNAPIACEPRHPSWFLPEASEVLQSFAVTRVVADPPRVGTPETAAYPLEQDSWGYWRWHGTPRVYFSAYSEAALQSLALSLRSTAQNGRVAWCIFDNTALGHSITNAMRLQELCRNHP